MPTDGERLATVEAVLQELRSDMSDMRSESMRTRGRLHDLEGLAATLVDQEKVRIRVTKEQQARMRTRIEVLTFVVAFAALFEPLLYHIAIGG